MTFAWQTFVSLCLFTCLVYVSTYCVFIALLCQNKPFRLLYLGQIMSTIQSRTPEKKDKNHVTLTWKSPWKISIAHLPFLSPNPKILKAFPKTLPTKMKPSKCPAREKKWGKKSEKRGEERKQKVKVKTSVSLLNPKTILKFCFLCMPELCRLTVCIWIIRPWSARPVNGFVVSFSSI